MPFLIFILRAILYGLGWTIVLGPGLWARPLLIVLLTGAGLVGGWIRFAAEREGPLLERNGVMRKVIPTLVLGPFFLFFLGLVFSLARGYELTEHLRYVAGGTLLLLTMRPALVPKASAGEEITA